MTLEEQVARTLWETHPNHEGWNADSIHAVPWLIYARAAIAAMPEVAALRARIEELEEEVQRLRLGEISSQWEMIAQEEQVRREVSEARVAELEGALREADKRNDAQAHEWNKMETALREVHGMVDMGAYEHAGDTIELALEGRDHG